MAHEAQTTSTLVLPIEIVGPVDISRLLRELEAVEDFLDQAAIRQPGSSLKLPRTSRLLDEFIATNKLNLLQPDNRLQVRTFLESLQQHAPVVHMSFASDPSAAFTGKIIVWLRSNIHPQLLMRVGLEPTIAAGCVLRTNNKRFDFSLRQHFASERDGLIKKLNGQASTKV